MSDKSPEVSQNSKKRDRSASESRLINAGILVFSKFGYKGSTTKMIAQKADVNESLIGRYFDGKEGLLLSIIEQFIEEMTNEELPYPPQENLLGELTKYLETKVTGKERSESLGKIIITQALTDAKFKRKVFERVPMRSDVKLLDRLQKLVSEKKMSSKIDLKEVCEEIETYLHGAFLFDSILTEMPKEKLLKRVRQFALHYTQGIETPGPENV